MNENYYELTVRFGGENGDNDGAKNSAAGTKISAENSDNAVKIAALRELVFELGASAIEDVAGGFIVRDESDLGAVEAGLARFAEALGLAADFELRVCQNRDWIEEYRRGVKPVLAGRFYVRPSWEAAFDAREISPKSAAQNANPAPQNSAQNLPQNPAPTAPNPAQSALNPAQISPNSNLAQNPQIANKSAQNLPQNPAPTAPNSNLCGGVIDIVIDPALAFGSGHHESTNMCLRLISEFLDGGEFGDFLAQNPAQNPAQIPVQNPAQTALNSNLPLAAHNSAQTPATQCQSPAHNHAPRAAKTAKTALDVGCGSGILSIALAKCGFETSACDTDELAAASTRDNAAKNAAPLANVVRGSVGAGVAGEFDFVVANIIADIILMLSRELKAAVKRGGFLLLSGILTRYKSRILTEFSGEFALEKNLTNGEWEAFLFRKN